MAEETIFSDQNVTVTTARIMISGTTYALRNVTSVKATCKPASKGCAIFLVVIGVFVLFVGIVGLIGKDSEATLSIFIGIAISLIAFFWLRGLKDFYHVTIASSSGEANALTSTSKDYIQKVVGCINEAIVRYRE